MTGTQLAIIIGFAAALVLVAVWWVSRRRRVVEPGWTPWDQRMADRGLCAIHYDEPCTCAKRARSAKADPSPDRITASLDAGLCPLHPDKPADGSECTCTWLLPTADPGALSAEAYAELERRAARGWVADHWPAPTGDPNAEVTGYARTGPHWRLAADGRRPFGDAAAVHPAVEVRDNLKARFRPVDDMPPPAHELDVPVGDKPEWADTEDRPRTPSHWEQPRIPGQRINGSKS